ncbi:TonB-dependent receptor plug domain-containing protein [Zhongshania guokunii]|uniref:TonB-dependent receptor plug domain-containing protein n=1 Tax=Zhongshania guokunii TaxID=641783 RepID=A0ABV3U2E6_9GAMM
MATPLQANFLSNDDLPIVLTPARLKQSRSEVPASVSVIDREMIKASGLLEIPELFRLIPGTSVGARDGWNYVVSYHGSNYRDSRRMQVLIDGRSVYQAGLATVDWNDIPITIEDIERIEVVRGPSTASYGANAFLGVINIITRHPADIPYLEGSAQRGSEHAENYRISHADEYLGGHYRITIASRHDDGFDIKKNGQERLDSKTVQLFNTRYERQFNNISLSLNLGYKEGRVTDDYSDIDVTSPDTNVDDYYFSSKIEKELSVFHSVKFQYDFSGQQQIHRWTAQIPPFYTDLANNPAPLILVDANEDQQVNRHDIDFQDTYIWNESVTSVAGVHLKQSRVSSETYYGGTIKSNNYQFFYNIEKKLSDKFTVNSGGSYEYEEDIGKNFSPRLAFHYHVNKNNNFRFIYSEAIRTPDLLETSANWTYTGRNIRPANGGPTTAVLLQTAKGNPNLKPELIQSREIGYYGNFYNLHLQWDVKIFSDHLEQLMSNSISLDRFDPVNDSYLKQQGIETEIDYRPSHQWLLHGSYAYIKDESNTNTETTFTPRNSASVLVSYKYTPSIQISLSKYYARAIGTSENKFSRTDIRLSKTISFNKSELELSYSGQYRNDDDSELLRDNIYTNKLRQLLGVTLRY